MPLAVILLVSSALSGCSLAGPLKIVLPNFVLQNQSGIYMEEGKENGSFIASVIIEDNFDSLWNLSLTTDRFEVRHSYGNTWALYTAVRLDRELEAHHNFTVVATAVNNSKFRRNTYRENVIIHVLDVNDNDPVFWPGAHTIQIHAGTKCDDHLIRVNASDGDAGENGEISFSLDNYNDLFQIGHEDGVLLCKQAVLRSARYDLIVRATDHGNPARSSSTVLKVEVVEEHWPFHQLSRVVAVIGSLTLIFSLFMTAVAAFFIKQKCSELRLKRTLRLGFLPFNGNSSNCTEKCSIINAYGSVTGSPYSKTKCIYNGATSLPYVHIDDLYEQSKTSHCLSVDGAVKRGDLPDDCGCASKGSCRKYTVRYFERPIAVEIGSTQISNSDDGCYCSSDISSENSDRRVARQLTVVTSRESVPSTELKSNTPPSPLTSENSDHVSASFV